MDTTLILAQIYGLYFVIVGLLLLTRPKQTGQMAEDFVKNRAVVYMAAIIMLVGGVIAINVHNYWGGRMETLVSVISWLVLLKAIFYFFASQKTMEKMMKMFNNKGWFAIEGLIVLILGAYLLMQSY